jgi:hypothetical protein
LASPQPPPVSGNAGPRAKPGTAWHSRSWWAGIGGIATLIGTLVAAVAWLHPLSSGGSPATGATATDATATGTAAAPAPLAVAIVRRGIDLDCDINRYYLPQAVDELRAALPSPVPADGTNPQPQLDSTTAWTASRGGFRQTNWIEFTVEGSSSRATILTGLSVRLVASGPLRSRTRIAVGDGCGAAVTPRTFTMTFGTDPPGLAPVAGQTLNASCDPVDVPAVSFPFKVSETDPEVFDLSVAPDGPVCDCEWTAVLAYTQGGISRNTVIDDHGQPFHAVPTDRVPGYELLNGALQPDGS